MADSIDELDAESAKRQRAIEELGKRRREKRLRDLQKVLSFAEGRRFVWRILTEARVYSSCFEKEPTVMAFMEGKRDVGLFIANDLPSGSMDRMAREHESDLKADKREIENETQKET